MEWNGKPRWSSPPDKFAPSILIRPACGKYHHHYGSLRCPEIGHERPKTRFHEGPWTISLDPAKPAQIANSFTS